MLHIIDFVRVTSCSIGNCCDRYSTETCYTISWFDQELDKTLLRYISCDEIKTKIGNGTLHEKNIINQIEHKQRIKKVVQWKHKKGTLTLVIKEIFNESVNG